MEERAGSDELVEELWLRYIKVRNVEDIEIDKGRERDRDSFYFLERREERVREGVLRNFFFFLCFLIFYFTCSKNPNKLIKMVPFGICTIFFFFDFS